MRYNLKLPSGQIISGNDPNYDTYLKQGATEIKPPKEAQSEATPPKNSPSEPQNTASQASSAQSGITYQPEQNKPKNSLISKVQATGGDLRANPNFVNAVYKAYYNRDASKEELDKWTGHKVSEIRQALTPKVESQTTITPEQKYTIPSVQDNTDAFVKSVSKLWENLNQPTDTEKQYQDLISQQEQSLQNLYGKEANKPLERQKLEEQFKIAEKEQKIQQVQAEMQQKIAEYNLMKEKISAEPILSASIAGQQAHLKRVMAAEIAVDSAKLAAYQGQYDLAEKQIQRALDQEFGAIKNQIEATKTFLDLNYNHLSEAQKKHANKLKFVLGEMDKLYNEQRADREDNYKILMQVLANGGDGSSVDFNKSPEENLITNRDYLTDENITVKTVKAGGRNWLVAYDAYGNVINKTDLGSAYKSSGGKSSNSDKITKEEEYQKAQQFIKDNPNATDNELEIGLRSKTKKLNDEDIKLLIDSRKDITTVGDGSELKAAEPSWWDKVKSWFKSF